MHAKMEASLETVRGGIRGRIEVREVSGGLMMKLYSEYDGKSMEFFEQRAEGHGLNCNFPGPLT